MRDAAQPREAALQQQQIGRRQDRAIADVEIVAALDRKARDLVALEQNTRGDCRRVEAALGDRDQSAGERRACRRHRQAFEALVEGKVLKSAGTGNRLAARQQTVTAIIEAHDLLDALDADIEHAVGLRERLGVEPAARGQRLAVGPEHRRHLGVGDAGRLAVLVDDAAAQPGAVVGHRQKVAAVRLHAKRRDAAERLVARGERKPAAEFQRAEAGLRRIAIIERRRSAWRCTSMRDRRCGWCAALAASAEPATTRQTRQSRDAGSEPAALKLTPRACARAGPRRALGRRRAPRTARRASRSSRRRAPRRRRW